jgi:hypothetical protein
MAAAAMMRIAMSLFSDKNRLEKEIVARSSHRLKKTFWRLPHRRRAFVPRWKSQRVGV